MDASRYVYAIDLDTGRAEKHRRPEKLADLSEATVDSPGKCATIHVLQGVAYVGAHSRCAASLWRSVGHADAPRPRIPWVAFRGINAADAAAIAWAWMEQRGLAEKPQQATEVPMSTLAEQFAARLREAIEKTRELGYNPQRFANKLETTDAVHLANQYVATSELHDGFVEVIALGHPELTMESIMLEPQFAPLFSSQVRAAAQWRLRQAQAV